MIIVPKRADTVAFYFYRGRKNVRFVAIHVWGYLIKLYRRTGNESS